MSEQWRHCLVWWKDDGSVWFLTAMIGSRKVWRRGR